jgi:hypothetical protein
MSRSDIPITCLTRYRAVARLQLSHFCCPDTTPRDGCLSAVLFCVNRIVSTYALVTFHAELVCTVQHIMGPRLRSLKRDNLFGELRSTTLPRETNLPSNIVLSPYCSRRYRQYELRFKPPPKSATRGRYTATHTDALVACGHGACMSKVEKVGGAVVGEYAYTRCTTTLA